MVGQSSSKMLKIAVLWMLAACVAVVQMGLQYVQPGKVRELGPSGIVTRKTDDASMKQFLEETRRDENVPYGSPLKNFPYGNEHSGMSLTEVMAVVAGVGVVITLAGSHEQKIPLLDQALHKWSHDGEPMQVTGLAITGAAIATAAYGNSGVGNKGRSSHGIRASRVPWSSPKSVFAWWPGFKATPEELEANPEQQQSKQPSGYHGKMYAFPDYAGQSNDIYGTPSYAANRPSTMPSNANVGVPPLSNNSPYGAGASSSGQSAGSTSMQQMQGHGPMPTTRSLTPTRPATMQSAYLGSANEPPRTGGPRMLNIGHVYEAKDDVGHWWPVKVESKNHDDSYACTVVGINGNIASAETHFWHQVWPANCREVTPNWQTSPWVMGGKLRGSKTGEVMAASG